MSNMVTAVIDKLRVWCAGEWKTCTINSQPTKLFIQIHYDQLFILTENKVLESLNLNGKIKGIYKNDVLILIMCNSHEQLRKIKFQIKTNIAECFHKLSLHFPVVNFNNPSKLLHLAKYKKVEDVLKTAINKKGAATREPLLSNFKDFVKLCLLDPNFPRVVNETQDVLKKIDVQ